MSAKWAPRPSLAAHSADIHQSKDTLCHLEPLTNAFIQYIKVLMNPFCAKTLKLIDVVPFGDHGTERVKYNSTWVCLTFTLDDRADDREVAVESLLLIPGELVRRTWD